MIWPALIVLAHDRARHVRARDLIVARYFLFGLFLSFSRGAWFHFAVSTRGDDRACLCDGAEPRSRACAFSRSTASALVRWPCCSSFFFFDTIQAMFEERAHLIQSYDVGQGGRFRLQELALAAVLNFPYGMGPLNLPASWSAAAQHVSAGFLVYGWLGAMAYLLHCCLDHDDRPSQRPREDALAALSYHRCRNLRRRNGGGRCDRHRPLAALLSSAWHDLGAGGGNATAGPSNRCARQPATWPRASFDYFLQRRIGWCWAPPGIWTISQSLKPTSLATRNR